MQSNVPVYMCFEKIKKGETMIGYVLQNKSGEIIKVEKNELKRNLLKGTISVTNLQVDRRGTVRYKAYETPETKNNKLIQNMTDDSLKHCIAAISNGNSVSTEQLAVLLVELYSRYEKLNARYEKLVNVELPKMMDDLYYDSYFPSDWNN